MLCEYEHFESLLKNTKHKTATKFKFQNKKIESIFPEDLGGLNIN